MPRKPRDENGKDLVIIYYGVIASGNKKIKDAIFRDKHAKETGILCFEFRNGGGGGCEPLQLPGGTRHF